MYLLKTRKSFLKMIDVFYVTDFKIMEQEVQESVVAHPTHIRLQKCSGC